MTYLDLASSQDFLKAALKQGSNAKSIRKLSQRLGFASDRGVGMVLKGQRPMSIEMQTRLAKFLKLTDKERLHLHALVRQQRTGVVEPVSVTKHSRAVTKKSQGEALHPLEPHYALTILDTLWIAGKGLSPTEIRDRLRAEVSLEELQRTLEELVQGGYLKLEAGGYFRGLKDEEYLVTPADVPSKAVREIHRAQLQRAAEVLEKESVVDREFIAKTLVIPKDQIATVKRLLREKLEEIAEEIAVEEPARDSVVAQMNVQFYLQSK